MLRARQAAPSEQTERGRRAERTSSQPTKRRGACRSDKRRSANCKRRDAPTGENAAARWEKVKARTKAPRGVAFLLEPINAAVSLNPTMVSWGQLKRPTTSLTDSHHEFENDSILKRRRA